MHPPLAFLVRPEGGTAKIQREWFEASDWAVLFTLGTLFFLMGAFAMWAWIIWRRSTKPEPHIQLLMELEDDAEREQSRHATRDEPESKAPWEQAADWWKKVDD